MRTLLDKYSPILPGAKFLISSGINELKEKGRNKIWA
jgi:hypothetical protein